MFRCLRVALSGFLCASVAANLPDGDVLDKALHFDDECLENQDQCSLKLAQLRAVKLQGAAQPQHATQPKHETRHKTDAKGKSAAKSGTKTQPKQKAKSASKQKTVSKSKVSSKSDAKAGGKSKKASKSVAVAKGKKAKSKDEVATTFHHPKWLKDCKRIFLDLGANIGVNVRKMYEPKKYLGDKLEPYFQRHFGGPGWRRAPAEKNHICALGFEPNPALMERLGRIEKSYKENGWHVHFYPYAIWRAEGQMYFNSTAIRESTADLTAEGGHLNMRADLPNGGAGEGAQPVRTINLASFIDTLPQETVKLVLMDIEGAEYETMAQLMAEKKLCRKWIWNLLVEAHTWGEITHWGKPESFTPGVHPRSMLAIRERVNQMNQMKWCGSEDNVTYVAKLDDETFQKDVDDHFGVTRR